MNLYDDDDEAVRPATVAAGWAQGVGLYLLLLSGLCSGIIFLFASQSAGPYGTSLRSVIMIILDVVITMIVLMMLISDADRCGPVNSFNQRKAPSHRCLNLLMETFMIIDYDEADHHCFR